MKFTLTYLLLFISFLAFSQDKLIFSKVQINLIGKDVKALSALGLETDHGHHAPEKHLVNIFDENELKLIREAGFDYKVIIDDVQTFYKQYGTMDESFIQVDSREADCNLDGERYDFETPINYNGAGSMGGYLNYEEAIAELDKMHELYPNLITPRQSIGDILTHDGNLLYYMVISDNPMEIDTLEEQIYYNALHHAREPNSLSQLIFYMWYVLENYGTDAEVTHLVDNVTMFFQPIVNPDGYIHNQTTNPDGGGLWRKNRFMNALGEPVGVDLNRNYGYFWGFDNQGSSPGENDQTYRGESAFSEPETQAVRKLCVDNKFKIALNCHTSGNLLIHPWGYSDEPTDEDVTFKSIGRVMSIENDFTLGTGTETVGYVVNGDSDDWMYGELEEKGAIYSMTPEVGPSFWPSPTIIDQLNKSTTRMNLNAAHLLNNFAWATERMAVNTLSTADGKLFFRMEKSGLKDGLIGFSVVSNTPGVSLSENVYPDLDMAIGEMMEFEVNYQIDETAFVDETISISMLVDNGQYVHETEITKTYNILTNIPNEFVIDNVTDENDYAFTGAWGITTEDFVSAPSAITDSPNGNYSNNVDSEMVLNTTLDLSDAEEAYFKFHTKFKIESDYDFTQFQVSTDGVNFTPVCGNLSNAAVPDQLPDGSHVYDGDLLSWEQESICLNDFIGEELTVRFIFHSDVFVDDDGFFLDDLRLEIYNAETSTLDLLDLDFVTILPNPSKDFIKVSMENKYFEDGLEYQLVDMMGRTVLKASIDKPIKWINIASLQAGTYVFNLFNEGKQINSTKFIKQ